MPQVVNITLERALAESRELRELYEHEDWARHVIDNARRLEGICRNASTHAAGVVIGSEPLANIVPLQRSTAGDGTAVTQYDMNGVSQIGLLKIDLLGLSNLTVIAEAAEMVRANRGIDLDIDQIPLDDTKTYELLGKADTHGIFQLEATFAKRILIDMQPKCLEDIGVAVALNRPGPIEGGATATWMRRKRGEEPVTYMLPELEPILKETYGAILYQDQVMKIASAVAGFTLGEADILRAAMGKKDKVKMAKQREQFLRGAAERGVAADTALQLFELIALFAGYGFNGAHSISYGLIAYQTAYLKANYPREYMCALLNSRADNFDKLKQSILDTHARGLVVRPPDVNRSASAFSLGAEEQGEILYGLRHIKNVGERVAAEIVAERDAGGPFVSLFDLCLRVSSRDLNRRVVEALIRSGACDSLGERGAMLAVLDRAIDRANTIRRERESGQTSLFGDTVVLIEPIVPLADELESHNVNGPFAIAADERLSWEREFLGMYLSDHPLRRIAGELQQRVDTTINELGAHLDGLIVQVGGAIRDIRTFIPRRSTTGQRMAALQIEDLTGSVEVVVFARVFEECANALRPDAVIVVRGKVEAGRSANGLSLGASRGGRGSCRPRATPDPRRGGLRVRRSAPRRMATGQHRAHQRECSADRRSRRAPARIRGASGRLPGRPPRRLGNERRRDHARASTSRWSRVLRSNVPSSMWSGTAPTASRCAAFGLRNASARQLGADGAGRRSDRTEQQSEDDPDHEDQDDVHDQRGDRRIVDAPGHLAAVQSGERGDEGIAHGPHHLHHRVPRIGMEHREQDADEDHDSDRDRDVDDQLFDEGHDGERGVEAATEDQCLQDLRDEVDDDDRQDRREVDAAEARQDAAEGRKDGVDDDAQPADDRVPWAEPDPRHGDARKDEHRQHGFDETDDVEEEQLGHRAAACSIAAGGSSGARFSNRVIVLRQSR